MIRNIPPMSKEIPHHRRAIVFQGGGALGAYEVGFYESLYEKFIKEKGGTVQRSKVGEANVIDLMLENNAQAGGEGSSGGFILPEFNYCREGILTGDLIASML